MIGTQMPSLFQNNFAPHRICCVKDSLCTQHIFYEIIPFHYFIVKIILSLLLPPSSASAELELSVPLLDSQPYTLAQVDNHF